MLSKNELKYFSGLLAKKHREVERKFIVEGKRLFIDGLKSNFVCEVACVTNQFQETNPEIIQSINEQQIRLEVISTREIQKLCDTKSPQGITAVFNIPDESNRSFCKSDAPLIVGLDQISDPGNLGTIIRTCDWFGIEHIILSESCVDIYNPKVVRSSMGSIFNIQSIQNVNLAEQVKSYKPAYRILVADLSGTNINDYKNVNKSFIIFSNEAHGPSSELNSLLDERVTIEGGGKAESLNVASAAAIIISNLVAG